MSDTCHRPWLKFYSDAALNSTLPDWNQSLGALLDLAVEKYPNRPVILANDLGLSYADFKTKVLTISCALHNLGVEPGTRIALMLPNLPQMILAFWGVIKAAGVIVMVNPLYKEKELLHNLNDAKVEYVITTTQQWPMFLALKDKLPIKKCILIDPEDNTWANPSYLAEEQEKSDPMLVHWSDLFLNHELAAYDQDVQGQSPLLLQYTGGTTGTSKGVILTHANLAINALQVKNFFTLQDADAHIFLDILPFFHVYGLCLGLVEPVAISATMLPLAHFDPRETLQTIAKFKPTIFPSAPAMFVSLLQQKELPNYDLKSIRICMSGSAPLPQEIFNRFQEITGAIIVEGYGLTEASPVTHFNPEACAGTRERSIGIPINNTDARIVDMEAGALTLEPGKKGELVIRGPQVMQGYLNNPDETASALRNDWLYTGDIAVMDEDGFFYIVDRKKDMAIVGGYNVFPREVDEVLMEHPKVLEAVSVGLTDPLRGEVLKAFIVVKPGEHLSKAEIVSFCRSKLASYKVPRQVEFRDSLPRTIVGKILRRHLRLEEEEKLQKKAKGKL